LGVAGGDGAAFAEGFGKGVAEALVVGLQLAVECSRFY
jgi:hypothetical protein